MRYAKTYYSTNGWTGPQNLSRFGQRINNLKKYTLGYEEFNFTDTIKRLNMLYIPCFSYPQIEPYGEIELFFHQPNLKGPWKYGKITGVSRIDEKEIPDIRKILIDNKFPDTVKKIIDLTNTFPNPSLKKKAFDAWHTNFMQDNILANGNDPRFIVNVKYNEFIPYDKPIKLNRDLRRARHLY